MVLVTFNLFIDSFVFQLRSYERYDNGYTYSSISLNLCKCMLSWELSLIYHRFRFCQSIRTYCFPALSNIVAHNFFF